MIFFRFFLNNPKVECPRCLGKGHVDWNDIRRLKRELIWIPGKCAYCNGKGKVSAKTVAELNPDTAYLTLDTSKEERKRLINKDKGALHRAEFLDSFLEDFIKQVEYLHSVGNLDAKQIHNFFLIAKDEANSDEEEKREMLKYIEKIIRKKNGEEI